MSSDGAYWSAYLDTPPNLSCFPAGEVVLDIGCGDGEQLARLAAVGYRPIGLEPFRETAQRARCRGYPVVLARAEQLPFRDAACPGVLCKVVIPYTDERRVVGEVGRVLRRGGVALLYLHGLGFYLRYLLRPDEWRHAIYAARAILNTVAYRLAGRRLPGFLGDTLYQSRRRMRRYYRRSNLTLQSELVSPRFLHQRVFFAHMLLK